jgi:hypothetical protein
MGTESVEETLLDDVLGEQWEAEGTSHPPG